MKAHTVVVQQVYYQPTDSEPVCSSSRYAYECESSDPPYGPVTVNVGQEPQKLKIGWMEKAGELVLRNKTGDSLQRIPTKEQKAAIDSAVVEVSVDGAIVALLRPGRSCRFEPADLGKVRLHCRSGAAVVSAEVFPG